MHQLTLSEPMIISQASELFRFLTTLLCEFYDKYDQITARQMEDVYYYYWGCTRFEVCRMAGLPMYQTVHRPHNF